MTREQTFDKLYRMKLHGMAQALEEMPEVVCYVKNQGLGFTMRSDYKGAADRGA